MAATLTTALITGAGSGIGRGIARTLDVLGLRLALVGWDERKLEQTRDELEQGPETALAVACDMTDRDAVAALVQRVLGSFGSIDVLVCNAGINVRNRSLEALSSDDWDKMIAVNLTGPFNPTSAPASPDPVFSGVRLVFQSKLPGVNNQLQVLIGCMTHPAGVRCYERLRFGLQSTPAWRRPPWPPTRFWPALQTSRPATCWISSKLPSEIVR